MFTSVGPAFPFPTALAPLRVGPIPARLTVAPKAAAPTAATAATTRQLIDDLADAHSDVDFAAAQEVSAADVAGLRSALARYDAESRAVTEIANALTRQAEL